MKQKTKDVTPAKSVARKSKDKKSANYLPKILDMVSYNGSLQQQWVKCGKANCKCSRGQLHGPYFYLFVSMSDGLWKSYIRRSDLPVVRAAIAERKRRHSLLKAELRQTYNLLREMVKASIGVRR
jgi:hypothetical protein